MIEARSDGNTYWDSTEYSLIQLLPSAGWHAVFVDDNPQGLSFIRTEGIDFIALANVTHIQKSQPTADRGRCRRSSIKILSKTTHQEIVGVSGPCRTTLVVNSFCNCLGVKRIDDNLRDFCIDHMEYGVYENAMFPIGTPNAIEDEDH